MLPAGHYKLAIRTRKTQFPMETLYVPLLEWPSLKCVPSGPFDIDHTENRMVVPCFHVQVDDQPAGLAWFDIPSAEMGEQRYFRTEFGIVAERDGMHTIRLQFRDGEKRIGWDDVEEIDLLPDERQPQHCPTRDGVTLWAEDSAWQSLRERPTQLQRVIFDSLRHSVRSGFAGTYSYRITLLSLLHGLGDTQCKDELRSRVFQLLDRRYWGFLEAEGELGCDNDRDAGIRLMEMCCALGWAGDAFNDAERARMREKIRHHARIFYRFTILQKAYWPDTTMEAHGLGGWLGLTTAAALLHRDDPEARVWLDWCYGNFLRNASFLPRDGFNPWPVFNPQWSVYSLALFETLTGRRLLEANPFFASYGPMLSHLLAMGLLPAMKQSAAIGAGHLREEPLLMSYLGKRNRDERVHFCAAESIRQIAATGGHLPPLTLLFATTEPAVAPPALSVPRTFRARSGHVATFDDAEGHRLKLEFNCGSPQGPENVTVLNRYMQFHNSMNYTGNYTVELDGELVIGGPRQSYDYRTGMFQMVTVNSGGHIMEHRYGGYCFQPCEQPFIRFSRDSEELLCVQAELRPIYRADLPLTRAVRHLCLVRGKGILIVLDEFAAASPLRFAHHIHTPGEFVPEGNSRWKAKKSAAELCIASLLPAGCEARVGETAYVPTYSLGLNAYKSPDWQPEAHAQFKKPPSFQHIEHTTVAPVTSFVGAAVYALHPLQATLQQAASTFTVELTKNIRLTVDPETGTARLIS